MHERAGNPVLRRFVLHSGICPWRFFSRRSEVRILFNNGRIFTTQFKSNGDQLFGSQLVNDFSDCGASGIENMIEAKIPDHRTESIQRHHQARWIYIAAEKFPGLFYPCNAALAGASSEGLSITALPPAMAPTRGKNRSWKG